ncbi:hypothetical protein GQ607_009073 [Colletotrichum asianum]|uniref:Uncharacterized protein n=1 Tax=Colletotrichum asianum TaxID=702518 RepID=A0A8H3WFF9_9PEZI|nr:hypothetical protein GQ607_009073 [Colletotrichum asianum]
MSSRELASLAFVTPHAACSPSASREIILLSFSKQRFLNQGGGKGGAKKKRRNGNQRGASYFASLPCNPPATNVKGAIDGTPAATPTCRLGRRVASATCRCTTKQASRLGRSPLLSLSADYSAGVAQGRGRERRASAATNLVRRGRWALSRDRAKLSNSTNVTGWELQMGSSHRRAGDQTVCGPNAVRCRSSQAGRQAGGEVCCDMFGVCGLASSCLFARAGGLHHTIAAKTADGKHSVVNDQAMTVWQLEDAAEF